MAPTSKMAEFLDLGKVLLIAYDNSFTCMLDRIYLMLTFYQVFF